MIRLLLAAADLAETISRERLFRNQPNARLVSAHSRAELLALAKTERPQLVVVDADRYKGEIDDLIKELRRVPAVKTVPIILTTATWRESLQELLLGAGANALVTKPLPSKRLYELVRAAGPAMTLDIRVPVGVEVTYTAGAGEQRGRILNVSKGGLYLECGAPAPVGTRLRVALSLPAFTNLAQVEGLVTWANDGKAAAASHVPAGMGIKFVDTPMVVRKTIALFVSMSKEVVRVT